MPYAGGGLRAGSKDRREFRRSRLGRGGKPQAWCIEEEKKDIHPISKNILERGEESLRSSRGAKDRATKSLRNLSFSQGERRREFTDRRGEDGKCYRELRYSEV